MRARVPALGHHGAASLVQRRVEKRPPIKSTETTYPSGSTDPGGAEPPALATFADTASAAAVAPVAAVRLARHVVRLDNGYPVGVSIAGRGIPLVVAHGFTAQGLLYAQSLSRLVGMGFKVVAVDTPGHGRTPLPRRSPASLAAHVGVLRQVIERLGIEQAVLLGHSMGGRLVTEVAAAAPERVVALVLVDAIVGSPWDDVIAGIRSCPVAGLPVLGRLVADSAKTIPVLEDPRQTLKLASLVVKALATSRPLQLTAPGLAIVSAPPSVGALSRLRCAGVPAVVIHGADDRIVPLAAGRDAAERLACELVVIAHAGHAWLLRDPETLPAVVGRLLSGSLGDAWVAAVARTGLDPSIATTADIEARFYRAAAAALALTPPLDFTRSAQLRHPARYRWTVERPEPRKAAARTGRSRATRR